MIVFIFKNLRNSYTRKNIRIAHSFPPGGCSTFASGSPFKKEISYQHIRNRYYRKFHILKTKQFTLNGFLHKLHLLIASLCLLLFQCTDEKPTPSGVINGRVVDAFGNLLDSVECSIIGPAGKTIKIAAPSGRFSLRTGYGNYNATISRKWYATSKCHINLSGEKVDTTITLKVQTSYLRVTDSLVNASFASGSKSIKIESNSAWTVTSDSPWLSTLSTAGSGTMIISLVWQASQENASRSGKITISSADAKFIVTVTQSGAPQIVAVYGRIGNKESNVADSVVVEFNLPISIKSIQAKTNLCLSDIRSKVSGSRLSFSYECASLGGNYDFTITLRDAANNTCSLDMSVPFFKIKKDFDGWIQDYVLSSDNQWIWAVTQFPNQFLQIAVSDLSISKSFPLPVKPNSLTFNNYSNKFNIFSMDKNCYGCGGNVLYALDPENGDMTEVTIVPIPGYDHPIYPAIFPWSMSMFQNGLGVLITADESGNSKSRYIDASRRDTTYVKDDAVGHNEYNVSCMNFDKSLIYLRGPSRPSDIDIMSESGDIQVFKSPFTQPPYFGLPHFIVPNKLDNRVYVVQLYEQFISDMKNSSTKTSFIDTRAEYSASADFSYRPGDEQIVYYSMDGSFQVLDYANTFTRLSADVDVRLSQLNATTDGKLLIGVINNGTTVSSAIQIFDLDDVVSNAIMPSNPAGRRSSTALWVK